MNTVFVRGIFAGKDSYPHLRDHGIRILRTNNDDTFENRVDRLLEIIEKYPNIRVAAHSAGCAVALRVANQIEIKGGLKLYAPVPLPGQLLPLNVSFALSQYLGIKPQQAKSKHARKFFFNGREDHSHTLKSESPWFLWKLALLQLQVWERKNFIPKKGTRVQIFVGSEDKATPPYIARKVGKVLGVAPTVKKEWNHFPFLDIGRMMCHHVLA